MIIPMRVKVDFGALHEVKQHVRGIGVTLFVNWLVKPFSISLFGFESGAALATVVGVLIEVPVMLLVVKVVNSSKGRYKSA